MIIHSLIKILEKSHSKYWEIVGTFVGFLGCFAVISQIVAELNNPANSTMSLTYLISFLIIFIFWFFYGLRFNRIAIWLTNFIASALQIILLIICLTS